MPVLNEGKHATEGLLSEAEFGRSRDNITVASGSGVIVPGTVLGTITASGKFAPSPAAETVGIEGAETATAIALYGCDATSEDVDIAAITRAAQWKVGDLTFDASRDLEAEQDAAIVDLAAVGIIVR